MAHRVISTLFILLLGAILVVPHGVGAQGTILPVTPDPSQCTVTPMTPDELVAAATAGMTSLMASPPATSDTFTLPQGEPADQKTVDAITQTIVEALACSNTGNLLAYLSFYDGTALAGLLTGEGVTAAMLAQVAPMLATATPVDPTKYASLVGVREATVLSDGSVGMLVDTIFPVDSPDVQTDYVVFAEKDGKWLASSLVEDVGAQYGPTGGAGETAPTPTPTPAT